MSDASGIVVVQRVTKVFRDFWLRDRARAVDALSFEIHPREVFGLLGPNGSGKSTTIKMLLGLLTPTSGRIAVFNKPPSDVAVKKRIGYLPEESYLYGFLNARETLDYYGKLFEIDHRVRQKRIDELLDMVGLAGAQYRPVRDYSKGMQRRIGLAQALINDPDFLILDEPTTGLDPIGTRQVKDLILELRRRGKTVLLSSHLLADVEDCVDRMVILYGGKKQAEGTCGSLLESQSRTSIESDDLDEATLSEIDALIRARSGGSKSLRKVSRPRQSLESLFLDIVHRAQKDNQTTSGATAGGATASFLRSEESQGEALIDQLMRESAEPAAPAVSAGVASAPMPAAASPAAESSNLIESLVRAETPQPAPSAARAPSTGPSPTGSPTEDAPENVDDAMIRNLMGGGNGGGGSGAKP
jgi:ABC-2 type transport system ATP-binding protein